MEIGSIIALVVAVGGALTGLLAWRKTRAEAESINVQTSIELLAELRTDLDRVRAEVAEQRKRRQKLADELHSLQRDYEAQLGLLRARISTLEDWIKDNTTADPHAIS